MLIGHVQLKTVGTADNEYLGYTDYNIKMIIREISEIPS